MPPKMPFIETIKHLTYTLPESNYVVDGKDHIDQRIKILKERMDYNRNLFINHIDEINLSSDMYRSDGNSKRHINLSTNDTDDVKETTKVLLRLSIDATFNSIMDASHYMAPKYDELSEPYILHSHRHLLYTLKSMMTEKGVGVNNTIVVSFSAILEYFITASKNEIIPKLRAFTEDFEVNQTRLDEYFASRKRSFTKNTIESLKKEYGTKADTAMNDILDELNKSMKDAVTPAQTVEVTEVNQVADVQQVQ